MEYKIIKFKNVTDLNFKTDMITHIKDKQHYEMKDFLIKNNVVFDEFPDKDNWYRTRDEFSVVSKKYKDYGFKIEMDSIEHCISDFTKLSQKQKKEFDIELNGLNK